MTTQEEKAVMAIVARAIREGMFMESEGILAFSDVENMTDAELIGAMHSDFKGSLAKVLSLDADERAWRESAETVRLREGKYGLTREGKVVGPFYMASEVCADIYDFEAEKLIPIYEYRYKAAGDDRSWLIDGSYVGLWKKDRHDIIAILDAPQP